MNSKKNTNHSADLEGELSRLPDDEREEFMRTWELVGTAARHVENVPDVDEAWEDLRSRIDVGTKAPFPRRDRRARRSPAWRRRSLVAGGVLLAVAAILAWMWQRPVTAIAPAGQLSVVTLADGSTIQMNSGTRVLYRPRSLPGASELLRSVQLDGEAFFEVEPSDQPFIVETAAAVVEVLGTKFNVRSRAEAGGHTAEVTLASGRVRVSDRRTERRSVLLTKPGESARVGMPGGPDSSLVAKAATLDHVLAWRRDAFAAIDRPVASIVAELERKYALRIDVEDDVILDDSMTLLYGPGTGAERILHDLCLVQGCRYRPTSGGFAVFMPSRAPNN